MHDCLIQQAIAQVLFPIFDPAISVGLSRKGPWRLSRTLATHSGMTNQWFKVQGLPSVKDLWVNIYYPATARELLGTA